MHWPAGAGSARISNRPLIRTSFRQLPQHARRIPASVLDQPVRPSWCDALRAGAKTGRTKSALSRVRAIQSAKRDQDPSRRLSCRPNDAVHRRRAGSMRGRGVSAVQGAGCSTFLKPPILSGWIRGGATSNQPTHAMRREGSQRISLSSRSFCATFSQSRPAYFRCGFVYLPSGVRTPIQASRTC